MKTERLIGILSVLLRQEKTTAPELARRFEVSRRTISRDIETLCRAGIPICTVQGAGGGISIMDGYRMDRTLLTSRDMQMILAGLRSLDSASGSNYYRQLMEKLDPGASHLGRPVASGAAVRTAGQGGGGGRRPSVWRLAAALRPNRRTCKKLSFFGTEREKRVEKATEK